ncbi:uncharacterized protein LOC120337847 [Styela clava]
MTAPGSPSLLARLKGTPGSLRRKFRKGHSLNASTSQSDSPSPTTPPAESGSFKFVHTLKKHDENSDHGTTHFTCRFLGVMSIYTLKPEHCYGFAEGLARDVFDQDGKEVNNNHSANKCQIVVTDESIEISAMPRRHHNSGKRKPINTGTPPTRPKLNSSNSPTFNRVIFSDNRPRTISCDEVLVNDHHRNCNSMFFDSPHQISVLSPYANAHRHSERPMSVLDLTPTNSRYGRESNLASMPENMQENFSAKIPLHEVAYCVTVPSNERLFLLTSRQGSHLICRVFLFKLREKSNALTMVLANQFKRNFVEWQSQRAAGTKRKVSIFKGQLLPNSCPYNKTNSQNSTGRPRGESQDSGHEDCPSDMDSDERTNEELKSREFERRSSCMHSPENILRRRETESSGHFSQPTLSLSDFTTDEDSDQSDDNIFSLIKPLK